MDQKTILAGEIAHAFGTYMDEDLEGMHARVESILSYAVRMGVITGEEAVEVEAEIADLNLDYPDFRTGTPRKIIPILEKLAPDFEPQRSHGFPNQ